MTDLAAAMDPAPMWAKGEIPGTQQTVWDKSVSVDCVIPSRERLELVERRLKEFNMLRVDGWRDRLSTSDRSWLSRLTKKTTNAGRFAVLTNGDPRGLQGYLRHADMPNFPAHLHVYAMMDNASINRILRAL